jgi:crotonobetainyl-CoA:carnitine CoA-transferase CaiB-like acyl-CoA transferase
VNVLEAAGVPCGPVYTYGQMFADPQIRHRGMVQTAPDAEFGEVPHIRTPIRIGDAIRVRHTAPKLGEHNAEILGRVGVTEKELAALKAKRIL